MVISNQYPHNIGSLFEYESLPRLSADSQKTLDLRES